MPQAIIALFRVWPVRGRRSYFANVFWVARNMAVRRTDAHQRGDCHRRGKPQPWAIGYTGFGAVRMARGRVKLVPLQSSPQASPVAPTPETIRAQSYPLARLLHLYTATEPTGSVRQFIDFRRSLGVRNWSRKPGILPFVL